MVATMIATSRCRFHSSFIPSISAQGTVSEEVMAAIQREVRAELYEKLADQNKGSSGKVRE